MIVIQDVTLQRGTKVLLDKASVTLNPGERVALVGRNGAGKSSLFGLLNGTLHEDSGEVVVPAHWRLGQVAQNMPETSETATAFVLGGDTRLQEAQAALIAAEASGDGMAIAHAHTLLQDAGELDELRVPIGGGGLMAGSATAAKALFPGIRMVGVEPAAGDDTKRSLAAGERIRIPVPDTIADGQGAETPGEMTFEVNRRLVDAVDLVTDDQLLEAMAFAFDRLKIVLEPSGATGLASVMFGERPAPGSRVGVILSGGNVGLARFLQLLAR